MNGIPQVAIKETDGALNLTIDPFCSQLVNKECWELDQLLIGAEKLEIESLCNLIRIKMKFSE